MQNHRLTELTNLLMPVWQSRPQLNLLQLLQQLAREAGFSGDLADISDDVLIYHLKMRDLAQTAAIPGLQKDYESDFKTALLQARGIIKE